MTEQICSKFKRAVGPMIFRLLRRPKSIALSDNDAALALLSSRALNKLKVHMKSALQKKGIFDLAPNENRPLQISANRHGKIVIGSNCAENEVPPITPAPSHISA